MKYSTEKKRYLNANGKKRCKISDSHIKASQYYEEITPAHQKIADIHTEMAPYQYGRVSTW
jgi:hypothetical protein